MTKGLEHIASLVCLLSLLDPGVRLTPDTHVGIKVSLGVTCSAENARQLLVRYLAPGKIWLNDFPFDEVGLRGKISEIMANMAIKRVWIAADERVSYGEVVTLIENLHQDTPDLIIGIATKSQTGPVDPMRFVVWRDNKGHPHTFLPMAPCFAAASKERP